MPFFSLFFIIFGVTVLAFPDFLAYLIGFLFLFIGVNSLIMTIMMRRRNPGTGKTWSFGNYEIIRKK